MLCPPSEAEISETLNPEISLSSNMSIFTYYMRLKDGTLERPRTPLSTQKDRPLHEKFQLLLSFLFEALKAVWGGNNKDQVTDRMKKMASRLSGGIELG